jgi:hypothetical protein
MTVNRAIAVDSNASRQFRRAAPALVVLGLIVLIMAPSLLSRSGSAPADGAAARNAPVVEMVPAVE